MELSIAAHATSSVAREDDDHDNGGGGGGGDDDGGGGRVLFPSRLWAWSPDRSRWH